MDCNKEYYCKNCTNTDQEEFEEMKNGIVRCCVCGKVMDVVVFNANGTCTPANEI